MIKVKVSVDEGTGVCDIHKVGRMKKGINSIQRTTSTLINPLKDKETKVFTNKVNVNKFECYILRKVFQGLTLPIYMQK